MPDEEIDLSRLSPWLLRIVLDRNSKEDKKLFIQDVVDKINQQLSDDVHVIATDDNADNLVIRVRLIMEKEAGEDANQTNYEYLQKIEDTLLNTMTLKGIKGIGKVFIRQGKKPELTDGVNPGKEWILETDGVNLAEALPIEGVDSTRTISNDIFEVLGTLGIEAAR